MPLRARSLITAVGVSGAAVLALGLSNWSTQSVERFIVFTLLTALGSALKVRMPGMTGTYSLSFWFVLLAVASLTFAETMVLAAAAGVVQVLWRPKCRPTAAQVLFSTANLVLSAAAAYWTYNILTLPPLAPHTIALLPLTLFVYWTVNTGLVSAVLAFVAGGRMREIWNCWCFSSLPLYFAGAGAVALVVSLAGESQWTMILSSVPMMLLASSWHRMWVQRLDDSAGRPAAGAAASGGLR